VKKLKDVAVLLFVASLFVMTGCGSTQVKTQNDVVIEYQPEWYLVQNPEESDYLFVFGQADRATASMSITAAKMATIAETSRYVEVYVDAMIKDFNEQTGVNDPILEGYTAEISRAVSSQKFTGLTVTKQQTVRMGDIYRTFIAMSLPKANIDELVVDQARRNKALYEKWIAEQGFKEMDEVIKKKAENK